MSFDPTIVWNSKPSLPGAFEQHGGRCPALGNRLARVVLPLSSNKDGAADRAAQPSKFAPQRRGGPACGQACEAGKRSGDHDRAIAADPMVEVCARIAIVPDQATVDGGQRPGETRVNQRLLRRWHGYVGAFIAPSVLFFALTGAIQLFGLHEARGGYTPPSVIERLGRLHKDQVFGLGKHHRPPSAATRRAAMSSDDPRPVKADQNDGDRAATTTLLLKWFFLAVALGLALSTAVGIWIALSLPRSRQVTLALLLFGAAVPVLLLIV